MSRALRRRLEREVAKTRPAPGSGQGWRLTAYGRSLVNSGRPIAAVVEAGHTYPVREPSGPFDAEAAEVESDAIRRREGIEG